MVAIEIRGLTVESEGYPVISGLDFDVREGERASIVGERHDALAILDVLSGLVLPTSGEIWIYNMPPRQALLRGLTCYLSEAPLIPVSMTTSSPILLAAYSVPPNISNTKMQLLIFIEIPNKIIQESYESRKKGIRLLKEVSDCECE